MSTPAFADTEPSPSEEPSLTAFAARTVEFRAHERVPGAAGDGAAERYRNPGSETRAPPADTFGHAGTVALAMPSPGIVVWSVPPAESSEPSDAVSEGMRSERAELQEHLTHQFGHEISARRPEALERADAAAATLGSTTQAGRLAQETSVPVPDPHDPEVKPAFASTGGEECVGGDVSQYPNGEIPESALCPLPQPGHTLRADAAAAFMRLDEAYQAHFGYPMCVTDAYRPLSEQERLYEEKEAGMAARPGTSQHGVGVAVDLCGGVQEHGSEQYEWLMSNAGDHGWHNPPWAQDGFEPWHWEYEG
ncbi:M15 family metallopeptidase [Spiractinospora alimapuensis]|uniref:M15 family metallopeptidase n=1 Tax=Spiractinospora alimapuensis TaxID=2820884 RepID=UPI001F3A33A1|nr:M15 family metallopeptidase [Spiractinospora alimapuensis]